MDEELVELAKRYRVALEARAEGAISLEDEAEAQAARDGLLADLAALGGAIGVAAPAEVPGEVVWTHGVRTVTFSPRGAREIGVAWRDPVPRTGRLYREAVLGHRWVFATHGVRADRDRVPFRNQGLEALLQDGLSLPAPPEGPLPSEAAPERHAADDAGPPAAPKRRL